MEEAAGHLTRARITIIFDNCKKSQIYLNLIFNLTMFVEFEDTYKIIKRLGAFF